MWVIPNIEHFALADSMPAGSGHIPDVVQWAIRDYGARVGIWRLAEVLDRFEIRATVALNSDVCDAYPRIIEQGLARRWEFMGHGQTNTRRLIAMTAEEEAEVVHRSLQRIERAVGRRPDGWLSPGLQETWQTLDLLAGAGLTYVADWVNDDQPYFMEVGERRLISVPYSQELNDKRFEDRGINAAQFEEMIRRQFDVLYEESEHSARVMAIALHPYIIGVPHRIRALEAALAYVHGHPGIWWATGAEIARGYREAVGQ